MLLLGRHCTSFKVHVFGKQPPFFFFESSTDGLLPNLMLDFGGELAESFAVATSALILGCILYTHTIKK